ncbi:hypothetical protein C3L33_00005, partial [Rhododendron williamsianum]
MTETEVAINIHDHGMTLDDRKRRVQCNYCAKVVSGFSRLKCHLGGVRGDVAPCEEVPTGVKDLMRTKLIKKKKGYLSKEVGELSHPDLPWKRNLLPYSNGVNDSKQDMVQTAGSGGKKSVKGNSNSVPEVVSCRKRRIPSLAAPSAMEDLSSHQAQICIARFFYENDIDFSAAKSPSFKRMINATLDNGQTGFRIPSYQEMKGQILRGEVEQYRAAKGPFGQGSTLDRRSSLSPVDEAAQAALLQNFEPSWMELADADKTSAGGRGINIREDWGDSTTKCAASSIAGSCNSETKSNNPDESRNDHSFCAKDFRGDAITLKLSSKTSGGYIYRLQLEKDVQRLQQQLQEEMELHAILENAIENNAVIPPGVSLLPAHALELLSSIALLESAILKLEEEFISLHFQVSQERNERRLTEYRWRHSSQPLFVFSDVVKASTVVEMDTKFCQPLDVDELSTDVRPKDLWDNPNRLSEEMVRCMKNIFISLADSTARLKSSASETQYSSLSPCGHLSNSSMLSLSERSRMSSGVQSPQLNKQYNPEVLAMENTFDPYRVGCKLSWGDIGSYRLATEVSWMSVGRKQLEYAAGALRRFSLDQLRVFYLSKAAYTIGGHSLSAAAIEYVILKMKPPAHRPQIALLLALHKLKVLEEQRKYAIDSSEPLVAFALSCGLYSSPAIRIYTASNVREELHEAQRDFIRASVGVSSKGRLLVPKMLHCFSKSFVDDANLAVWISHYLPPHQAAFVEQCISKRRQSLLSSRNCGILPFDSRFRYLFLPEQIVDVPVNIAVSGVLVASYPWIPFSSAMTMWRFLSESQQGQESKVMVPDDKLMLFKISKLAEPPGRFGLHLGNLCDS